MGDGWSGKTALITGASAGIGASFAEFLAGKGLQVIMAARREERLASLAEKIHNQGGKAEYFALDLSLPENRDSLFQEMSRKYQSLDILINNAGFGWYGYFYEMPKNLASQMIAVNMEAVVHLTFLFLKPMLKRGSGHIINIGSIAGGFPNQGVALYSATKAFLDAFTTSLHRELRGSGVHASVMRLGPVESEFFDAARRAENGGSVPAERLAAPVQKVNDALWRLMEKPRRVMYVPGWLRISRLADPLFGWLVDRLGPLLLRREKGRPESAAD